MFKNQTAGFMLALVFTPGHVCMTARLDETTHVAGFSIFFLVPTGQLSFRSSFANRRHASLSRQANAPPTHAQRANICFGNPLLPPHDTMPIIETISVFLRVRGRLIPARCRLLTSEF